MSLRESGDSSGKVSLEKLCRGELTPAMTGEVDLKKLIELIIRGGWPGSLGLPLEQAALLPAEYLNAVIDDDVYRMDGVKRDTQKMRLLLRSLARNESTTVTNKTLMKDIKAVDGEDIDGNTVAAYLDIFKRLFLTDNQLPFSSGIRSSVRVKQAENLLEIKRQIEEDPKGKPPAVLCVLCGLANAAYQRPDGVFVVPVTALRP